MDIQTMILNALLITTIITIGIDYLHFDSVVTSIIKRILTSGKMKEPFWLPIISCSTCSSWWLNLVYIAATGHFTLLNITIILLLAVATPIINDAITLTMTALQRIISLLDNILQ